MSPATTRQIPIIRPFVHFDAVKASFREIFETGVFTKGPFVDSFGQALCRYTGARYAYLTSSATTALWTCLKLLNIGPGDEVIVSDFSFPASANVIEDVGARPVFADVSTETFNAEPQEIDSLVTHRTKAVMFVDTFGNPSGAHSVLEVCRRHGIPLIEDAACALGSGEFGKKCGSIADLTCFSFHPRKLLTTGEGGAILTNNEQYADWLSVKLAHGGRASRDVGLNFEDFGYNFRLSEMQAAMGLAQIPQLEGVIGERHLLREQFIELLAPYGFRPQQTLPGVQFNVQSVVFVVPSHLNRDEVVAQLRRFGIESTLGTYAQSATEYFSDKYQARCLTSAFLCEQTITLPCFSGLDLQAVVSSVLEAVSSAAALK